MLSTVKINGNILFVCYFYQWHVMEGGPGHTCESYSDHGSENGRTHTAHASMGKRSNHNRSRNIVLTNYPRSSTLQSPAGQVAGLGPRIGTQVGTLNCTPKYFCA